MRTKAARDDLRERVMDGVSSGIAKGAIRHEVVLGLLDMVDEFEAGAQQTALLRGLPLPQHLEDMLARLWTWTTTYGEALCPRLRGDTFGEGMREAKEQVSRLLVPYMQHPECSICRRRHGAEVQHACE
jgi:hypothetical protein